MIDLGPLSYAFPPGGMPPMHRDPQGKAVFTSAYALIPADVMRDIVTSRLPGWADTWAWILARPLTGFAETFAQYAVEVAPGGGSDDPDCDAGAESVLFFAEGQGRLGIEERTSDTQAGTCVFLPPGTRWTLHNPGQVPLRFHWIRKRYRPLAAHPAPAAFVTTDHNLPPQAMNGSETWFTSRFVDPEDLAHDMHVNIVTFLPGGRIPFAETHVMEHGLYVLQGTGRYLLNTDWVDVGPGDFMWLRAFCPQACIATGDRPFRYLLYKDVNRHPDLVLP